MKIKPRHTSQAVIPTASMADIAFLLIIFFMVTITFEKDKSQVVLPETELRFEIPKEAAYVAITREGAVRVTDGEEMSTLVPMQDIVTFASNVVAQFPGRPIVLKIDEEVPYEQVDEVLDSLKRAKVELIYLLSQQTTVEGGGAPAGG